MSLCTVLVRRAGRVDDEMDDAALAAADHVDHAVELHVDRIDRLVRALADGEDPVAGLEPLVEIGRAAGDDFLDRGVAVVRLAARRRCRSRRGRSPGC